MRLPSRAVSEAVFIPQPDGTFLPTELSRGPWDPAAQHGGAPAALLAGAILGHEGADDTRVARLTVEFLRPVPLVPLTVTVETVRPGRRVQLLSASLWAGELEACRALGLRVGSVRGATAPVATPSRPPDTPPAGARPAGAPPGERPTFGADAVEARWVRGHWHEPGPATAWMRLAVPLVAGRVVAPLERAAGVADFGNGVSAALEWGAYSFVNPDLTLYLDRDPAGEWIQLDAVTRVADDGTGSAESVLSDEHGRVGRAVQALLIAPR